MSTGRSRAYGALSGQERADRRLGGPPPLTLEAAERLRRAGLGRLLTAAGADPAGPARRAARTYYAVMATACDQLQQGRELDARLVACIQHLAAGDCGGRSSFPQHRRGFDGWPAVAARRYGGEVSRG